MWHGVGEVQPQWFFSLFLIIWCKAKTIMCKFLSFFFLSCICTKIQIYHKTLWTLHFTLLFAGESSFPPPFLNVANFTIDGRRSHWDISSKAITVFDQRFFFSEIHWHLFECHIFYTNEQILCFVLQFVAQSHTGECKGTAAIVGTTWCWKTGRLVESKFKSSWRSLRQMPEADLVQWKKVQQRKLKDFSNISQNDQV